jgi:hypothetical protein
MTNLEIVLIYFAIGLMFTLVIGEIRRSYLDRDDILFGTTCWPVIIIAMIGWRVYQRIKRRDNSE